MASVSGEWKNPSDIMKKHLLQRTSSFNLTKTKSASGGFSRRHSFTLHSSNSQKSPAPHSNNSPCDTSTCSPGTVSQKRKNPFGCDAANLSKRRSVLDRTVTVEHSSGSSDDFLISATVLCDTSTSDADLDQDTSSSTNCQQNKLIRALTLQEQKDYFTTSLKTETEESRPSAEKTLNARQLCDVLKEKPVSSNVEAARSKTEQVQVFPSPPVDWSLKSKARVLVHGSIDSFKKYPGIDAKNVHSFVHHTLDGSLEWQDLDVLQQIKRCCMHYSYPYLPWVPTFPRLSSDFKSRSTSLFANSKDVLDSLQRDWSNTLTSVYQQLRAGLCPYFYVCAYQFSVLFRCLRSADSTSWSALLSPSTRGLREMLTKEGIQFRLPNIRTTKYRKNHKQEDTEKASSSDNSQVSSAQSLHSVHDDCAENENSQKENTNSGVRVTSPDDSSDDDNDIRDDDEASQWLEVMGLDKRDFPSLEPFKVKLQREGFREIDNRPQSMVYVEGVDVHSFFNFLLNYPCIASSGPQHGIPPTILSPVPFVGGRLVQNVVKHTTLNSRVPAASGQLNNLENKSTHVFEISGPILPHHALNMAAVLRNSCECDSASLSFSTYAPSAAFNTQTVSDAEKDKLASGLSKLFVDISQANAGLLQEVRNQILASPLLETGAAIRDMHVTKSGFSWIC
ncbi:unnamed protein product [Candidula unifasciata]|uniref:Uncharacterized protein n=1 Tax=Candidula unifasciata TaxID=100452 RepID=A0A8S3Z367_9EUPU|nr:unnamed protein product [Candidula unifasciata]